MKQSSKIALGVAAGVAVVACLHKKKESTSGIGATIPYLLQKSVLNEAQRLFNQYDDACEAERVYDLACDVVYENLQSQGIDPFNDANEKLVYDALFKAGLSDENGITDIYENRRLARKELLNFIYSKILPFFPFFIGHIGNNLVSCTAFNIFCYNAAFFNGYHCASAVIKVSGHSTIFVRRIHHFASKV